jgi:hypothetical protein
MKTDDIIEKIDGLEGQEQEHVTWLTSLLDHEDAIVRFSAIRPLIYRCSVPGLSEKLWRMLEVETDEDVLMLVISALSGQYRGTRDPNTIRRFQQAIERIGGGMQGTLETFDDAKLRVMLGLDTKQIVKMSSTERQRQLAEVKAKLGL